MDLLLIAVLIAVVVFFFWTGYDTYQQAKTKGRNAVGWFALIPWVAIRMLGPVPAATAAKA